MYKFVNWLELIVLAKYHSKIWNFTSCFNLNICCDFWNFITSTIHLAYPTLFDC